MNLLLQKSMKNLKMNYSKEKKDIKYEEYYFNGIYIPGNIEFKEIFPTSFKYFGKLKILI